MSELGRLAGVFFSPGKTFAEIARRPRWWVPVLVAAIFTTAYLNAFTRRVGWEQVIRQGFDQSAQAQQMPAQQREQLILTIANVYKYALGYGAPILGFISVIICAALMLLLFDVFLGAKVGFKRMLAVVAYGFLPLIVQTIFSMVVLFLKDPEEFDLQNPLMANAGAFLSVDTAPWIKSLASSFDLFTFWIMSVLAIGVVAASPKKMKFGKAFTALLVPWILYVIVKTSIAALQS